MPKRAVVVGASLAGLRAAETLRREGHDGPLTIIGAENHLPYDRPPLSKQVLTRKMLPEETRLNFDESLQADWIIGTSATSLDLGTNEVVMQTGDSIQFDFLVIATGAHPRVMSVAPPGPGVHYLRTIDDSIALRDPLAGASRVAVVGAGFIGLEVASSAQQLGAPVTVLEILPVALERALGESMGSVMAEWQRSRGIDLRLGVSIERVDGKDGVEVVRLGDGTTIEADVLVVGIGAEPSTGWLEGSGIDLNGGVVCDTALRVRVGGRPRHDIVAAGDVARWGGATTRRHEHWTNAAQQGEAAALTLLHGEEAAPYSRVPYFWSDQHGVKFQLIGEPRSGDKVQLVEGSLEDSKFVVAYGRNGRVVAAAGIRSPSRVMSFEPLIERGDPFPIGGSSARLLG